MAAKKKAAKKASKAAPRKASKPAPRKASKAAKAAPRKASKAAPRKASKAAPAPRKKAAARPAPAPKPVKIPAPKKARAPLVWKFQTKASSLGISVDKNLAWMGNDNGEIFAVNHTGEVQHQFALPDGVKAIIADEAWRYAGCDNGNVYDLTGRVPRLVYAVAKDGADILWMDIFRGNLAVADGAGGLTVVDAEDALKWQVRDKKNGMGWMVRCDASGVYHGCDTGVTKYDWDGKKIWHQKTRDVLFGWQEDDKVYAGTVDDKVVVIEKTDGKKLVECKVPGGTPSCAASPGGKYIFGANFDSVFCFDEKGTQLWELEVGAALSMQYLDEKLYVVTSEGFLGCIDVGEAAIEKARAGHVQAAVTRKAPKVEAQSTELEKTSDTSKGVVVECVKEGGKLRVRVVSDGYNSDWFCQFPKDIREDGARYVVDEVREATQGGFYRVLGDIRRLST